MRNEEWEMRNKKWEMIITRRPLTEITHWVNFATRPLTEITHWVNFATRPLTKITHWVMSATQWVIWYEKYGNLFPFIPINARVTQKVAQFFCILLFSSYFCIKYRWCAVNGVRPRDMISLSAGWRYNFRGIIIALVLYSVMSLNLGNSIDIYTT